MASFMSSLLQVISPKKRGKKGGQAETSTFDRNAQDGVITAPLYREHTQDLFETRQINDSRDLMETLFEHDPDVSAALNAFLTLANTPMVITVRNFEGEIDREGLKTVDQIVTKLCRQLDYSLGFQSKSDFETLNSEFRFMALLRGTICSELVLNKALEPDNLRHIDARTIKWVEKASGEYKPIQESPNGDTEINLDIPTFFTAFFRRNPSKIYTKSFFVSSINTIAARHSVINDLYRIMRITGFPRVDVTVIEEVLRKNAPQSAQNDENSMREFINGELGRITNAFANVRSDQAMVHTDSIQPKIINDKNPAASLQVGEVIEVLNAQNQAALKSMGTILGRGQSGTNTASTEARLFSMSADELNVPVAEIWSKVLTFALNLSGVQGIVHCKFAKSEMRPETELEPQFVAKSARLKQDLSLGLITDDEYHLKMYGRIKPEQAPELSGTGFMDQAKAEVDVSDISPNDDPLGQSITPDGNKIANSNGVKTS